SERTPHSRALKVAATFGNGLVRRGARLSTEPIDWGETIMPNYSRSLGRAAATVAALILTLTSGGSVQGVSSPSGSIVFASFPPGTYGNGTSDLFSIHPDGTGLKRLTNTPDLHEQQPAFSRDGSKLVYRVADRSF